ncbi:MAG TPA: efflux RND transporter periplasmic adaptor subunit [Rhodocyclaceae bacterium]|nr:efflux RND transporter periplasmic adaptor subunit [Rhodocyclaceae bacterium]HRQ45463.1 efflux RND transporter periplasmic adaptor subunit [Rhodocyclaceae bacterium]
MQGTFHFPAGFVRWLVALVGAGSLAACGSGDGATPPPNTGVPHTPVAAVEIHPRDLSRHLSLSGTVEPRVTVRLAARTSGAVEEVLVEAGDEVEAGQLLVRLDISEARAELARARAELESARLDYRRAQELRQRGVVSAAQYEGARVALQVAESELALWRTRVEFGSVHSPLKAVVSERFIEPGEAVQAQSTLFELAALDELVIRLGVSELDVVHLTAGQAVPVRLDAFPGQTIAGSIRRISPVAQAGNRLITVEVALPTEATAMGVRPGFLARVGMAIDPRPNALVVPTSTIGMHEDRTYVFVIENGQLRRRHVETGVTRGQWTEILNGLEPGETVLASNPLEMREGQAVRIVSLRD